MPQILGAKIGDGPTELVMFYSGKLTWNPRVDTFRWISTLMFTVVVTNNPTISKN